jgi:tetratricopeptide (TPR) repeat protein
VTRPVAAGWIAAALLVSTPSAHAQKDRFVEGVGELTAAVATADADKAPRFTAALARMAAGLEEWDRFIERFERLGAATQEAVPEEVAGRRLALGRLYLERGRVSDALREFDAALALTPRRADIHVLRGLAFDASGNDDAALAAWRAAWNLAPADPIAAYQVLQRHAGDPADGERARHTLTETYRALLAGTVRLSDARFPEVVPLPDSLSEAPVLADVTTREVFPLLVRQQYTEAVAALRRALAAPVSGESAIEHFLRGRRHEADNQISAARREYAAAVAGALAGRSTLYAGIGRLARLEADFVGAIDAFTTAVRLTPNDPAAHRDLARAYLEQDRPDDALPELIAALLIDPRDAWAHATLGQTYLDAGRYAEAVTALTRALELKPATYEPRYALAAALTRMGRTREAAKELDAFDRAHRQALEQRRLSIASEVR